MGPLTVFEIGGKPDRMGEAFGEHFRQKIRDLSVSRQEHLREFLDKFDPGRNLTRDAVLEHAGTVLEAHEAYDAGIWREFDGIARGAGLTPEELLVANGLTDLQDFVLVQNPKIKPTHPQHVETGCSAFVAGRANTPGKPIVGQTWDMNYDAVHYVVLVRRKPDNAPETLCITTTGCLCLVGMNSEGVSVGNTNLVATDATPGVNYLFTITRALRSRSAREASQVIQESPRLSGHFFYTADAREAVALETTAGKHVCRDIETGLHTHTNHYLEESLKPFEFQGKKKDNSVWRQARLADSFARLDGPVTLEAGWDHLSDTHREEDCIICNEDYSGKSPYATAATIVQCPGEHRMMACVGGGHSGTRQELSV